MKKILSPWREAYDAFKRCWLDGKPAVYVCSWRGGSGGMRYGMWTHHLIDLPYENKHETMANAQHYIDRYLRDSGYQLIGDDEIWQKIQLLK